MFWPIYVKTQESQVIQLADALRAARSQLEQDRWKFRTDRAEDLEQSAGKEFDLLSQAIEAARDSASDTLVAPIAGTVESVDVGGRGTVIQPGQTVVTIVPEKAELVVNVDLPASQIGFVRVNQETLIKVTAFPFEEYGAIPGEVSWISPTAESITDLSALPNGDSHMPNEPPAAAQSSGGNSDGGNGVPPPTLYYRVRVKPQWTWLLAEGVRRSLRSGMTASVDIQTGQRSVLEFFFDPVTKYIKDGMSVH